MLLASDAPVNDLSPLVYRQHRLRVDAPHELRIEESGNPEGVPAVFLHGGPGGGSNPAHRETFDPDFFRILTFDQRGAGRSTPHASLEGNYTRALVADIEAIRRYLGIERWLVAGGSWGSCLALAYAETHPERCIGLRIHGIFTGSAPEIDWWFNGSRAIFPDHWEEFAAFVPEDERGDLLAAYYRRLTGSDADLAQEAAISLRRYSARTQTFLPDPDHVARLTRPDAALAISRIFTHYCVNAFFLKPDELFGGLDCIRHIPAEIVQGRYDTVTPMMTAWRLRRAWPEARFTIVTEANHAATKFAPALSRALREATDRLRDGALAAVA